MEQERKTKTMCHYIYNEISKEMDGNGLPGQVSVVLRCHAHGEYKGWKVEAGGNEIASICPECLAEERASDIRNHELEVQKRIATSKIKDAFAKSCVPVLFSNVKLDMFKPTCREAEDVFALLKRYVARFDVVLEHGSSFLFSGGTGTGKTTLACAVLNELLSKGRTGVYTTASKAIAHVKRSWVKGSEVSQDEMIERYRIPDILVIDEIGKGSCSGKDRGILFDILDERYLHGKPTIGVSLYPEKEVEKRIETDALRRLTRNGKVLRFTWGSFEKGNSI